MTNIQLLTSPRKNKTMNLINTLKKSCVAFLQQTFALTDQQVAPCVFTLNTDPDKQNFGDINANAAMILAKQLKQNPRAIAQRIADEFTHPALEKIEVAGPGFLNLFLTTRAIQDLAQQLYTQQDSFFKLDKDTPKKKILYRICQR